jgi:hypothetical protein
MADDDAPQASQAPGPFANVLNAAKSGQINIHMDLEQFVYLDRDCQTFIDNIEAIQTIAERVSKQEHWGLGENYHSSDGKSLISGQAVVQWFRTKSRGNNDTDDNSLYAIMESHKQAVQDIQETYRAIRKQITDHDAEAAARYKQLETSLPQQSPVNPPAYHVDGLPPANKSKH